MKQAVSRSDAPGPGSVEPELVRVGKDVIEILTSGMYVSPITIYREYIQNAADSIDAARHAGIDFGGRRGEVAVTFDHAGRSVVIRDNGAAIPARDAASILLSIGGSHKRGTTARGFRGVGRLSGLACCRELEFRSKAPGEEYVVSVIWDCRRLREKLSDAAFAADLRKIVASVVSVRSEKAENRADRFFEVHLKDVARLRNDLLLNEAAIGHYLAQVAPLPFSTEFSFAEKIEAELAKHPKLAPIDLSVSGESITRPHRDDLRIPGTGNSVRIKEIEFVELADVDGAAGAIAWIGHHEYIRSIPSGLGIRGLRARFGNLQVGDANLFDESFKESRFNGWSIGEIHLLDPRVVPNARRDNFEVNHHYYNLLVQVGPIAARLTQRCRSTSVSRNASQIMQNIIAEAETLLRERQRLSRAELSRLKAALLRAAGKSKRISDLELRQRLQKRINRLLQRLARLTPKRGPSVVTMEEAASIIARTVTNREQARKLIEALQKISG